MFDLLSERRLTFTALAQREDVNTSTVWRWALRGVRGVKLEAFSVGGRRYTTVEAFARFVAATTAAAAGDAPTLPRTARQRDAAHAADEAELIAAGA